MGHGQESASRRRPQHYSETVEGWATNSITIEANQTLLRILCYMPAGSNEAIQGLYKMLAGLLLASGQQFLNEYRKA